MNIHRAWMLPGLLLALTLTSCGGNMTANEAPPAAPFGLNVQNQNDDNNFLKYRDSMTVHDEGRHDILPKQELSQKIAEELSTMEGVHTAHVLLSGDQAFVAVTLRDHNGKEVRQVTDTEGGVSQFMKGSISDKVKTMAPGIRNVYMTDQIDIVRKFEAIDTDIRHGLTGEGKMSELSNSVKKLIPSWTIGNNPPPQTP